MDLLKDQELLRMTRYDDSNPQHRKELHEYLTRPASKSKGAFRSFTKDKRQLMQMSWSH